MHIDDLKGYVVNPDAKTLVLRFDCDDSNTAKLLYIELARMFSGFGEPGIAILPGEDKVGKRVVFQLDVYNKLFWKETLEFAYEFMSLEANELIKMGFEYGQVNFDTADIYGMISDEEAIAFRRFSHFTSTSRRVIINVLSQIGDLRGSLQQYVDELAALKIYNTQVVHTNSMYAIINRLAEKVGLEDDELIEKTLHRLH